ncbi:MAG: hypothetical protein VB877_10980 [Pirellulaceae bacterium]
MRTLRSWQLTILPLFLLACLLVEPVTAADSQQARLDKSLQAWQLAKKKCAGNYSYKVRWQSFVGFGHETIVVVKGNKVVERRYREFSARPVKKVLPMWVEKGKEVGSHKKGAAAKTLDQLYQEADVVVKRKLPSHERRSLRVNEQGLLLACYCRDTRIADDAPLKGVSISSIELVTAK